MLDGGYKITVEGLKFLEEQRKEKRSEGINKISLFLTTILVITTIASFFNGLKTINPALLSILYGIVTLGVWAFFKKLNLIKLIKF